MIKKKESLYSYNTDEKDLLPVYSKSQQWLITVACLSFFPLIYFLGKLIIEWIK